ncbi:MAG: ABC transporter permease [Planctomycetes bacterium]|nr:ABC transporter permease [Planctomycetota bacterium]
MNRVLRVARREYAAQVRTKGFLLSLLLFPVLFSGSTIAFVLLKDRVDTADKRIAVLDHSGIVAESLLAAAEERNAEEILDEQGVQTKPRYLFESLAPEEDVAAQKLALSDRVRRRELHAFFEVGPDVLHPEIEGGDTGLRYYSENPLKSEVRSWLWWPVNQRLIEIRAREEGLDPQVVARVTGRIGTESMGLLSRDAATGELSGGQRTGELEAILAPMAVMMILFIMTLMGALPLLGSTMEEKSLRIAEVLLGTISPFGLMLGKLLGGVAVSLTILSFYSVVAYAVSSFTGSVALVPFALLPWLVAITLASLLMFGAVAAAVGASCNDQAEASARTPLVIVPILIPMFIWFPILQDPLGGFATAASLVPPFTPALMTLRLASPASVPLWQPVVGFLGVLLFTLATVWGGARVFRAGILMQGQAPNLRTMLRWVFGR